MRAYSGCNETAAVPYCDRDAEEYRDARLEIPSRFHLPKRIRAHRYESVHEQRGEFTRDIISIRKSARAWVRETSGLPAAHFECISNAFRVKSYRVKERFNLFGFVVHCNVREIRDYFLTHDNDWLGKFKNQWNLGRFNAYKIEYSRELDVPCYEIV